MNTSSVLELNLVDKDNLSGNEQFFIFNPCDKIKYYKPQSWKAGLEYLYVDECSFNFIANINGNQDINSSILLLLEPRCIKPLLYTNIEIHRKHIEKNYYKIITHDESIYIKDHPKYNLLPFTGGSLILEEDVYNEPEKSKNISIIASEKMQSEGHKLRHQIVNELGSFITAYGPFYNNLYTYPKVERTDRRGYYNYITGNIAQAYLPYRFCIVVENQKQKYFFTEKIIDCFATRTIPIYWGATNISDYFNINGILTFNTMEELKGIIKTIHKNPEKIYNSLSYPISDNYLRHFPFRSFDENLKNIIELK